MIWEALSPILISVGVFAAIVAGTANVLVAIINNRRLKLLEKNKQMADLLQYRYIKLYDILGELCALEPMSYDISEEHINETVSKVTDRFSLIKAKYKLAKPLIGANHLDKTDSLFKKESEMSSCGVRYVYEHTGNFNLNELLKLRFEIEQSVMSVLQEQLAELIN